MSSPAPAESTARPTTGVRPQVPALVVGHVTHHRTGPVRHGFRHRTYQWLVDLDSLPVQPWYLAPFAAFPSSDHLGDPDSSIKANVESYLRLRGLDLGSGSRIVMLSNARVFGHVFNPLTVFWCFDRQQELAVVVAEVHNTYGERHAYLLRPDASGIAHVDKAFHVSPFFDEDGRYELRFTLTADAVATTVLLRRSGAVAFSATFRGRPRPATRRALATQSILQPLMTYQISALIRLHGIWLWLRRLPVHARPEHISQEGV